MVQECRQILDSANILESFNWHLCLHGCQGRNMNFLCKIYEALLKQNLIYSEKIYNVINLQKITYV